MPDTLIRKSMSIDVGHVPLVVNKQLYDSQIHILIYVFPKAHVIILGAQGGYHAIDQGGLRLGNECLP